MTTHAPKNVPSLADVERRVSAIWMELLGVAEVNQSDNFLLLGGESLMAGQAAARLQDAYGLEISLRTILVGTVAEVASEIVSELTAAGGSKC